jgi:hypothetical protein
LPGRIDARLPDAEEPQSLDAPARPRQQEVAVRQKRHPVHRDLVGRDVGGLWNISVLVSPPDLPR